MTTTYEIITEKILAELEAGNVPWQKPWAGGPANAPKNLVSGKRYRGINVLLLGLATGYASPYWLTFKQAKTLGGSVRKGEHGSLVVFFKDLLVEDRDSDDGSKKRIPLLKYYRVWNLDQTENVKVPANRPMPEIVERSPVEQQAAAEAIVASYPNPPSIAEGEAAAWYRPSTDHVNMPPRSAFTHSDEWYSTLFHELGHSTAHSTRLDRKTGNVFGSHEYGREELVAEMTSAFLCAEAGINTTTVNSAAYLRSWIKTIKQDSKAVVVAAGQAQKAADLISGQTAEQQQTTAAA